MLSNKCLVNADLKPFQFLRKENVYVDYKFIIIYSTIYISLS